ncbi:50S ribosomal protein L9 [Desulfobacter hydrogenophilus]|uniref:Large ribosomal subunit protein bL9 n=1 Tax=Desulfobacter hydrogenophilus TaxID=2291 RepID=A0A328F9Q4_9BACT|nr:50S ribosomal protein L9 [Desulfobacter hydrogenophilus]NDY72129.1 50S ribosomal protein L9 [Desulfobacter hydrogenophilus]QBH14854.1 50S ribosomal protein L9 [Desulfobacter hydrogenophilus]RAM01361.1 50S ribosomal protein L9 [Desulfobacter hydrogenophilus]
MKVILKETIDTLGIAGTECKVAEGYGRNYLLPQGKAVIATPANRKVMEQARAKLELQIAKERKIAEEMAAKVKEVAITIKAKVREEIYLYGSVTSHDIKDALDAQNVEVERRAILLAEPIKETGEYKVPIRLYKDVEPEITVTVVAEDKQEK